MRLRAHCDIQGDGVPKRETDPTEPAPTDSFDTFSRSHDVDLMRSAAYDGSASRANPNVARTFYVFSRICSIRYPLFFNWGYHGL